MELFITKLIGTIVVPPGMFFSLIFLGLLLRIRYLRTGQIVFYTGLISLILISTPLISSILVDLTQPSTALSATEIKNLKAKVIVILGGGRYVNAPEYNAQDTVSIHALERCRYGTFLQRQLKLPILVTGGSVFGESNSEAELMKQVIEDSFAGETRWIENKSQTTYENAILSYKMLRESGNTHILLVTHAIHMARSQEAFEKAGFTVTPAPLGFFAKDTRPFYMKIFPNVKATYTSAQVFHEWLGRLWYTLRYY